MYREAVIQAAFDAIARRGFEGLRLRAVAAEAGIPYATLHHHFATKQDLVSAVVERATAQLRATPVPGGTTEGLRQHLALLTRAIAERPELFLVLRELDLRSTRDPTVRAIVASREEGWRASLTETLGDPAAAELVIATVKGVSLRPDLAPAVLGRLGRVLGAD
ncbi:MAG TPA: helix-turn-helix domain-containing protein [Candidatus Dormibacteraeota bacterium]|nr:helix-turn-helix domain-containing protein [Candidatus Dormibacteraeota bacterium]